MSIVFPGLDVTETAGGLGIYGRRAVRVGSTVPGTLATSFSSGQTVDGITLAVDDRILIKNQLDATQNGIYVVTLSAPIRSDDFYLDDAVAGISVFMNEGTIQGDTGWVCTSAPGFDIVGINDLHFKQTSGTGVDGNVITDATQTLTNKSLVDATTYIINSVDATKRATFDASLITTGTTRTLTVPDANMTLVGTNTTQTLTNKTLTLPVISQISNSGTITLPTITTILVGNNTADTLTNKTLLNNTNAFADAVDSTKRLVFNTAAQTAGTTLTLATGAITTNRQLNIPAISATDTLVTENFTQTLTNKTLTGPAITGGTINGTTVGATTAATGRFTTLAAIATSNQLALGTGTAVLTLTNAQASNQTLTIPAITASDVVVTEALAQTLTNKTLTSPIISGGTINNATIGATTPSTGRFTTLTANSASITNTSNQITLGTTNVMTVTAPQAGGSATLTLPSLGAVSDSVTYQAQAQNLSNKTITLGSINNTPIGATTASTGRFTTVTATAASNQAVLGTGTGALTITSGQTTAQTLTLPNISGADTAMTLATAQTITGVKTFNVAPVISTITNTGTLTLPTSTDTLVGRATTDTLTNKTLTSPVINGGSIDNATIGATTANTGRFTTVTATAGTNQLVLGTSNPVTINTGTQTVSPTTLSIPDLLGVSDTVVAANANQLVRNKNLVSGNVLTYSVGTASQSGAVITGVGTTFTPDMTGGYIVFSGGQTSTVTYSTPTSLDALTADEITPATTYTIYYGGRYIFGTGINPYIQLPFLAEPIVTNISDKSKRLFFSLDNTATGSITTLAFNTSGQKTINIPNYVNNDTVVTQAFTQPLTNKTITDASNNVTANGLRTATGTVSISAAAAPTTGQVLTATGGSTATWQTPGGSSGGNFVDNATFIIDAIDPTVRLGFDMTGTTGQTLTLKTQQTTSQTVSVPNIPYADNLVVSKTEQNVFRKAITSGTEVRKTGFGQFNTSFLTGSPTNGPSFTNDGLTYYFTNQTASGSVYRYDVLTDTLSAPLNTGSAVVGSCLNQDNTLLFVANYGNGTMTRVNVPALTIAGTIILSGLPRDPILSADGTQVFVATNTPAIYRVNTTTFIATLFGAAIPAASASLNAFQDRSGVRVYVTDLINASLSYYNTSGVFQGNFAIPAIAGYGCADPARDIIYVSAGTNIYGYSTLTNALVNTFTIGSGLLYNIHVTTDGAYLYAVSNASGFFYYINLYTGVVASVNTSGSPSNSIALTIRPDNKFIIIGGNNSFSYRAEGTTYSAYTVGRANQVGDTINGFGTFWSAQMVGGMIIFEDGTTSDIASVGDNETLISSVIRTVATQYYTIYYGGSLTNIAGYSTLGNRSRLINPTITNNADYTKAITFNTDGSTSGTTLSIATNQASDATISVPAITASDTFMTLGTAQTVTGVKTIQSPIITTPDIDGGTIDLAFITGGTVFGASVSSCTVTNATQSGGSISGTAIDSSAIGATTPSTGRFTTVSAVNSTRVFTLDAASSSLATTLTLRSNQTTTQSLNVPNVGAGDTLATINATQTLTNKTLTTPTVNGGLIQNALISTSTIEGSAIGGVTPASGTFTALSVVIPTSKSISFTPSNNSNAIGLTVRSNQTTNQILDIPNVAGGDTIATLNATQTLNNKTLINPIIEASVSDPSVPVSGSKLYSQFLTGRNMLAQVGPSGLSYPYQPGVFAQKITLLLPSPGATTLTVLGATWTTSGTSARAPTNTSFLAVLARVGIQTTGVANNASFVRTTATPYLRGNASLPGGFFFSCRFGISGVTSTNAIFIGLAPNAAIGGTTDPGTVLNSVGFVKRNGSTEMQFHTGDAASVSNISLPGFPANAITSTSIYECRFYCISNTSEISYSIRQFTVSGSGVVDQGSQTSTLPPGNTLLAPQIWVTNGSAGGTASIDIINCYIETDL